jgi:hypothetical protein
MKYIALTEKYCILTVVKVVSGEGGWPMSNWPINNWLKGSFITVIPSHGWMGGHH